MPNQRIPSHVAIIMDGNGRWAQRRGRPRIYGHVRGAARVRPIVLEADRLGVKALTLYAFSTENWGRPDGELQVLWRLLVKFLKKEERELHENNVRLRVLGEVERLSPGVRSVLDPVVRKLSANTGLQLNFAVSYGSRRELARAAQLLAESCAAGALASSEIDEAALASRLWTADLGALSEVDLVIRTSGELRISNFLLWQAAYAELVFTETCWPDFSRADLAQAVAEYGGRERRFGAIGAPLRPLPDAGPDRVKDGLIG